MLLANDDYQNKTPEHAQIAGSGGRRTIAAGLPVIQPQT